MTTITQSQFDSLKNIIYNVLLDGTDKGEGADMGEMGNCMEAADNMASEWITKENIELMDDDKHILEMAEFHAHKNTL